MLILHPVFFINTELPDYLGLTDGPKKGILEIMTVFVVPQHKNIWFADNYCSTSPSPPQKKKSKVKEIKCLYALKKWLKK